MTSTCSRPGLRSSRASTATTASSSAARSIWAAGIPTSADSCATTARRSVGSRKQLDAALERLEVQPQLVTIFGGAVDPSKLHFPFNRMPQTDARDWQAIDAWSEEVGSMIPDRATVLV
jgi:hypothetical protein